MLSNQVSLQLAIKEIWRNKGRFLLISLVIALITLLVLFLAGLGEGLSAANKEYLSKLDADLVLFQEKAELAVAGSQIGKSLMNDIERVPGVKSAGAIGFSSALIRYPGGDESLGISLLGVESGKPGQMEVVEGDGLSSSRANEAIIDSNIARQTGLGVGDAFLVESTQGTVDELYELRVVGISSGQQFFFAPAVGVPMDTWERIRPKPTASSQGEQVFNIVAVQLVEPADLVAMTAVIEQQVNGIEAVDVKTAYESQPGYAEQQSTVSTQRGFTLLIGVLVVGGFFQIQTLQKVGQVGMLKALGASNLIVAIATILQVVLTNAFGVALGALATLLFSFGLPPGIPITFVGMQIMVSVAALLLIGPIGGLVSVRVLTRVEPLTALGLAS